MAAVSGESERYIVRTTLVALCVYIIGKRESLRGGFDMCATTTQCGDRRKKKGTNAFNTTMEEASGGTTNGPLPFW